jgi:hypothetical protein
MVRHNHRGYKVLNEKATPKLDMVKEMWRVRSTHWPSGRIDCVGPSLGLDNQYQQVFVNDVFAQTAVFNDFESAKHYSDQLREASHTREEVG